MEVLEYWDLGYSCLRGEDVRVAEKWKLVIWLCLLYDEVQEWGWDLCRRKDSRWWDFEVFRTSHGVLIFCKVSTDWLKLLVMLLWQELLDCFTKCAFNDSAECSVFSCCWGDGVCFLLLCLGHGDLLAAPVILLVSISCFLVFVLITYLYCSTHATTW